MIYRYTQTNLLETPHTYMYTPYEGRAFVSAYLDHRSQMIRILRTAIDTGHRAAGTPRLTTAVHLGNRFTASVIARQGEDWLPEGLTNPYLSESTSSTDPFIPTDKEAHHARQLPESSADRVDTGRLMAALLQAYASDTGNSTSDGRIWLNRLIQRFEVTKKIHARYRKEGLRAGEGPHDDLQWYAELSLILAMEYVNTGNLRFLSTLLKLNDTLASVCDRLSATPAARPAAFAGMLLERAGIHRLMEKRK